MIQIPEHSEKCQLGHDSDCPHEAAEAILKQVIEMVKAEENEFYNGDCVEAYDRLLSKLDAIK